MSRRSGFCLIALIAAGALALSAPRACAQNLRVRLLDEETHQPLAGVLVSPVSGSGAIGPSVLSSSDGIATLPATGAGPHRLLIRRIGFAPLTTDPVTAPPESGRPVEIVVPVHRIMLGTVHVVGRQPCSDQAESPSAEAQAAWAEVRTALEASALTRDQRLVTTAALLFRREVRHDGTVDYADTTLRGRSGERPFVAPAPAVLERDGYVRRHDDGSAEFYGPDEYALLSAGFTRLHCVSVSPDVRRDSAGTRLALAFVPRERGTRPEITGLIWLDSATSELRRIDFEYVRVPLAAPADSLGGSVQFEHLASGAWIVSAWMLRMPRFRVVDRRSGYAVLDAYIEVGGSASVVREVATPGPTVPRSIAGLVFDSVAHRPLSGAHVHLADPGREVVADSLGAFRFDSLSAGAHTVWADHPMLDTLGIFSLGARVDATPQLVSNVILAIPSFATLWQRACGSDPVPGNGDGFVFGQVLSGAPRNSASRDSTSGISINLAWPAIAGDGARGRATATRRTVQPDSTGSYAICGVPGRQTVTLAASRGETTAGPVAFRVGPTRIARRDLTLRAADAIAQGRVIRVIGTDGQPVAHANVSVEGGMTQLANEHGEVSLGAGARRTLTVNVRRIGYQPWFGTLDIPDTAAVLTVTLPRLAQALGTVMITERAIKSPLELTGFYDRWMMRQQGVLSAVFIGPEEIEFRHPDQITNLLRGLNGVCLFAPDGRHPFAFASHFASIQVNQGCPNCPMAIVIDGTQQYPPPAIDLILDANDVAAIEVYDRGGNMPISMQFNDTKCGVIAFWTGSRRP